jgi:hypothetical protein
MIPLKIMSQPDDSTCGPTSLHAVYRYLGDEISLEQVISEVFKLEDGGTLGVWLGCHALSRGYKASLLTYNLKVFDPTWFIGSKEHLLQKLSEQAKYKNEGKIGAAIQAYIQFLEMGGEILYKDLTPDLLEGYFEKNIPVLAGLSATHLYACAREIVDEDGMMVYDDIRGEPTGHFVVLCGHEKNRSKVLIADPFFKNPVSGNNYYSVAPSHLINSIMLGILTYDANLVVIEPRI